MIMMEVLPAIDMAATGERIIALRKAAGLSVHDLQEIFGFGTPQAIYKWQHGVTLPTIDNLLVLSEIFGVSINDILVLQNEPELPMSA